MLDIVAVEPAPVLEAEAVGPSVAAGEEAQVAVGEEAQVAPVEETETEKEPSVASTEIEEAPEDCEEEEAILSYAKQIFKTDGRSAATSQAYCCSLRKMIRGSHPIKLPADTFIDSFWKIGRDFAAWRKTLSKEAKRTCDKGNGVVGLRILHKVEKASMVRALK